MKYPPEECKGIFYFIRHKNNCVMSIPNVTVTMLTVLMHDVWSLDNVFYLSLNYHIILSDGIPVQPLNY